MTNISLRATAPDTTRQATRFGAIDSAKGAGIILVVFGHAWRGAMGAGLIPDEQFFRAVDAVVYSFHMPLFFLLSGLLFLETLRKYATLEMFRGRLTRLLWPMALWSWIFFGLKLLAGAQVNQPVAVADFPLIPLPPYEHLWFLWALFLCQSLLILVAVTPIMRMQDSSLRWGAAGLGLLMALLNPYVSVPSLIWGPMVQHFPYFLAGIAVGGTMMKRPSLWAGIAFGLSFAALLAAVGPQGASVLMSLIIVLVAWHAWLCLDQGAISDSAAMRGLRYLGQASMVIYLMHTAFTAAMRIVMLSVGLNGLFLVVLVSTLVGLVLPLGVLWAARQVRVVKLLGF